ncbi:MAG TPA: deoxyribonuclease V [Dehalococcoidia bacterium]|nr:deoxyribonuclease V [Dehalococcoidia bacterium]
MTSASARHAWDLRPRDARELQLQLAPLVETEGEPGNVRIVAGVDVAAPRSARMARVALVLLSFPTLEEVGHVALELGVQFPYVPGLLSFREAPLILTALERLGTPPDLLFVDGQGVAHPRRFGIASHIGLLTGIPTIGCAKSRLVGQYEMPGEHPGDRSMLMDDGQRIGTVVRTKAGARPLFVSPGHRIGFEEATRWVLACCRGHRLPEPTYLADRMSKASVLRDSRSPGEGWENPQ